MKVTAIKTSPIGPRQTTIEEVVDNYIPEVIDSSIIVVTSKIVSLCEGAVVPSSEITLSELAYTEADYYLSPKNNRYNLPLTIKANMFVSEAGIDQSNGDGNYVLWPRNPQRSANHLKQHLSKRHGVRVGVIISDSHIVALRRGSVGVGLAHSGFGALTDYVGEPDIFGRKLQYSASSIIDGLAAAAVVVMGEGAEQTPLAMIEDVDFVSFQDRDPTAQELNMLRIDPEEDFFAQFYEDFDWDKQPEN